MCSMFSIIGMVIGARNQDISLSLFNASASPRMECRGSVCVLQIVSSSYVSEYLLPFDTCIPIWSMSPFSRSEKPNDIRRGLNFTTRAISFSHDPESSLKNVAIRATFWFNSKCEGNPANPFVAQTSYSLFEKTPADISNLAYPVIAEDNTTLTSLFWRSNSFEVKTRMGEKKKTFDFFDWCTASHEKHNATFLISCFLSVRQISRPY